MPSKKHTGITLTLIGMLLPFFGSACLASASGFDSFRSGFIPKAEKSITFQKDEIPSSKSLIRQDVDYIHRLKNDRSVHRKFVNLINFTFNHITSPESSLLELNLVPKPAYYNYLFMLKPF